MAWPLPYCIEVATEPYTDSKGRRHKLGPVNERRAKVRLSKHVCGGGWGDVIASIWENIICQNWYVFIR